MNRADICPSCGARLRWQPPDFMTCAMWFCPRCKYKRPEGQAQSFWPRPRKVRKNDGR